MHKLAEPVYPVSRPAQAAAAVNQDVVITLAARPCQAHVISGVAYSYAATPTGGRLRIMDGAQVVLELDITGSGPGQVQFKPPLRGSVNTDFFVILSAGGAGVKGEISLSHWLENCAQGNSNSNDPNTENDNHANDPWFGLEPPP